MNIDLLFEAVASKGHVCVGLDTTPEYIPENILSKADSPAEAVLAFNRALVDATLDVSACYKVQIAYYEELGLAGLKCYRDTLRYIHEKGGLAIADIKRGDIADTASRYAKAHLDGEFEADFVTLAPYMGMDSVEPWLKYVESKGKGLFVLMRTSNKGMRDFEYRELKEGGRLYDAVGNKLDEVNTAFMGSHGYGAVGAVVGCTEKEEAATIRSRRSRLFFLIPGYGAQGGAAADAALLLRNGNGGVVNASRSILKAWSSGTSALDPATATLTQVAEASRRASVEMRDAIRQAAR